jgi:hypothetical protein
MLDELGNNINIKPNKIIKTNIIKNTSYVIWRDVD